MFGVDDGRVAHFVAVQVPIPRRSRSLSEARCGGARGRLFGACRNEVRSDCDLGCNLAADLFVDVDNRGEF